MLVNENLRTVIIQQRVVNNRFENKEVLIQRFEADGRQLMSRNLRSARSNQLVQTQNFNMVINNMDDKDEPKSELEKPAHNFYATVKQHCVLNEQSNRLNSNRPWSLLQWLIPNKHDSLEKQPFAMYALEIHTPYSKREIKKKFLDIAMLQKIVSQIQIVLMLYCFLQLVNLKDMQLELRDQSTGQILRCFQLKNFLPILPKFGRSFMAAWNSSSSSQNKNDIIQRERMHKIRRELSGYFQQILLILDIFYFKNLEAREKGEAYKLQKRL